MLHDGKMEEALYEFELKEFLKGWESSMAKDKDDFIFAMTENKGDVAMVLIEKSGQLHIGAAKELQVSRVTLSGTDGLSSWL